jgi:urea transport system ATP-binding protein
MAWARPACCAPLRGGTRPSGGTITLDGQVLHHPSAAEAARAGIAYVPQGREIFPLLTVTENLQTGFACLPRPNTHTRPDL